MILYSTLMQQKIAILMATKCVNVQQMVLELAEQRNWSMKLIFVSKKQTSTIECSILPSLKQLESSKCETVQGLQCLLK